MPELIAPATVEELREALRRCGDKQISLESGGSFSKRFLGGPVADTQVRLTTGRLNRLRAYEPADLTVSVESGMRYKELSRVLAEHNQFLPLNPPCADEATVGGILASNSSGPRRRRYGTARDVTIGMRFATLDGKLVSSGGMVVKNVTGLDMGKLMIGSFGTLAVIASANFKVFPKPDVSVTFAFRSGSIEALLEIRREILVGVLQPTAIDWLNPRAAHAAGLGRLHVLLVEASGTDATARRFGNAFRTLAARVGVDFDPIEATAWDAVRNGTPEWLRAHPGGSGIRVSSTPSRMRRLLELATTVDCGVVLRAGNAVGQVLAPDQEATRRALEMLRASGYRSTLEAGSDAVKRGCTAWDASGNELDVMQRIKADFDPLHLLNRGRLYGVI